MHPDPLLIVDPCGVQATLAVFACGLLCAEAVLPERAISATLLGGIAGALERAAVALAPPLAIAVVHGPGSFTGVRVGVAVVKGLAEGAGLRAVALSRLEVLQDGSPGAQKSAVLWAGRDQLYMRTVDGREQLTTFAEFGTVCRNGPVLCAADEVERFAGQGWTLEPKPLGAATALAAAERAFASAADDLAAMDANYVREEGSIYRRRGSL